jgi:hypothetical protein
MNQAAQGIKRVGLKAQTEVLDLERHHAVVINVDLPQFVVCQQGVGARGWLVAVGHEILQMRRI